MKMPSGKPGLFKKHCTVSLLTLSCALASVPAHAVINEVVVEAERTEGSLQEVPVAVAAFDEDMLEAQGIESLRDLSLASPSLHSYDFPTSTTNLSVFLRGYGNPDSQTLTIDNPIGIYLDGVYLARTSTALIDVLDLERVEVLRGPQGTLFGRNSAAGAIQLISKKPGSELGGYAKASVGRYGHRSASATIDIPFSDILRTKFSVGASGFDGWVDNTGANSTGSMPSENFYAKSQQAFRAAFSLDLGESVVADYSYDYADVEATPQYFQQDTSARQESTTNLLAGGGPWRYILPDGSNISQGHTLEISFDLDDNLSLKSISSYRELREATTQNWSDTLLFGTDIDYDTESISQEFQLSGAAMDGFMDFIAGLYWFQEKGDKTEFQFTNFDGTNPTGPEVFDSGANIPLGGSVFDTDLESIAVYVHNTMHLSDDTQLRLGVRYTEDDRKASRKDDSSQGSVIFGEGTSDLDYDQVDWLVSISQALSDDINAYARISTGYRAGGISERALTFDQDAQFDPEESISYEVGVKADWLGNRLRTNLAVFQTEVDNYILTLSGVPPNFASFVEVVNGDTTFTGAELDTIFEPVDNLRFTVNYAYLDTELKNAVVSQGSFLFSGQPASGGGPDLRGQDISGQTFIPMAPRHAVTTSLDFARPMRDCGTLELHVDHVWRDDVNSQPKDGLPVEAIGLFNARAGFGDIPLGEDARFSVHLWGKNLDDEEKIVYDLSGFGFQYNEPRTYGLDMRVDF